MSEPITEAMLKAGVEAWIKTQPAEYKDIAAAVFRAMEAAREAEKIELSPGAKDMVIRLAMGEQPDMEVDIHRINEIREHRLIEAGSEQPMVRWGIKGELTPLPANVTQPPRRMFFRLTEKGAAYIARETSNG